MTLKQFYSALYRLGKNIAEIRQWEDSAFVARDQIESLRGYVYGHIGHRNPLLLDREDADNLYNRMYGYASGLYDARKALESVNLMQGAGETDPKKAFDACDNALHQLAAELDELETSAKEAEAQSDALQGEDDLGSASLYGWAFAATEVVNYIRSPLGPLLSEIAWEKGEAEENWQS